MLPLEWVQDVCGYEGEQAVPSCFAARFLWRTTRACSPDVWQSCCQPPPRRSYLWLVAQRHEDYRHRLCEMKEPLSSDV